MRFITSWLVLTAALAITGWIFPGVDADAGAGTYLVAAAVLAVVNLLIGPVLRLLSAPMIILQGAEDEVVPPAQAEMMVQALAAKGLPYAYLLFEGEQHGFRKAEHIVRAQEAELSFYAQVLGFEPGDPIEPVHVENLPARPA